MSRTPFYVDVAGEASPDMGTRVIPPLKNYWKLQAVAGHRSSLLSMLKLRYLRPSKWLGSEIQ
jgi:hypothetical protein